MSTQHPELPPFRIEVVVDAPRETVWRALQDPDELRRWFGWDYEGLEAEVRYIFLDHAEPVGQELLRGDNDQSIELEADGPRTVVRVVHPGPLGEASWDDLYDEVVQGWRTFLQQLRFYLEDHRGQERRTLFLTGRVVPKAADAALAAAAPGQAWDAGRHQRSVAVDRWGGALISLVTAEPLDGAGPARAQLTVTTYGLDDAAFERLRSEWIGWWRELAEEAEATP
jgi:hypothetical protein